MLFEHNGLFDDISSVTYLSFVHLSITQRFLNRFQGSTEKIGVQLFKTSSSDRCVEVDTLEERINFNAKNRRDVGMKPGRISHITFDFTMFPSHKLHQYRETDAISKQGMSYNLAHQWLKHSLWYNNELRSMPAPWPHGTTIDQPGGATHRHTQEGQWWTHTYTGPQLRDSNRQTDWDDTAERRDTIRVVRLC